MTRDPTPVWFVPWMREGNPYQTELAKELENVGYSVADKNLRLSEICRSLIQKRTTKPIVHLHWLPNFEKRSVGWLRAAYFVFQLRLLRALGATIVWTVHNLYHHESAGVRLQRWTSRWVYRMSNRVIAHSEAAQTRIEREFGAGSVDRIAIVPHGTYVGVYANDMDQLTARVSLGLSASATVCLFLGQIRPYKGVECLAECFRELPDDDVHLVIAGRPLDSAIEARIRAVVREDARISLHFRFIPDEEIQIFMNAADVVVFPYLDILTSGAVILAMSFGRACIVPRLAGMPELLGNRGGILYDPDDAGALERALIQARDAKQQLAAMGQRNRTAVEKLGWDRIAAETSAVYDAARMD